MWNDGWFTTRSWNNLYNDYELNHCCFGDGGDGNGDSGGYGEDTGLTAEQAEAAMAAADAAAAAGLSAEAQQAAADAEAAQQAGFSDVADYTESEGITGVDPSLSELDTLDDLGLLGYNSLESYGYFDKKDAAVDAAMQAQADKRTEDLAALGIAADINYDPEAGVYSYDAPTFGQAAGIAASDVAGSLGRGVAGAVDTIGELAGLPGAVAKGAVGYGAGPGTISGAVASALGKDPGISTADRMGLPEDPFQMPDIKTLDDFNIETINRETITTSPEDLAAMERANRAAEQLAIDQGLEVVSPTTSGVPNTLSELMENLNATPEYDPFSPGPINERFQVAGVSIPVGSPEDTYQAAYDRNMASVNQAANRDATAEFDPSATGYQEAYDRNLQETMASLADTTGTSDIGGDNKTPEDKKEEETEVTTSDARPRSIAEYFASNLTYPPSSFKPNQYLTALLQRISPNEDLESIYRRLGYYDLPPRTPTDTETGVA